MLPTWSRERKRAYANDLDDPDTSIAVDRGLNRQKELRIQQSGYCQLPTNGLRHGWLKAEVGMTADRKNWRLYEIA